MSLTLTEKVAKKIIKKLINGDDYRIEIVDLINTEFLQYTIEFFKKVVDAKLKSEDITTDWYKKEFLSEHLSSNDIAINSGLNKKTITNMHNSASKKIVIEASEANLESLYRTIQSLVDQYDELDITLTLKFQGVSVDLNVSESLIVINTIAVKRAALRGGLWSTAGKRVEKPLMQTLCKIFGVDEKNYAVKTRSTIGEVSDFTREVDFHLISGDGNKHKCEVKLMGKGNPESADAVIARDSKVFIADKLSSTNKKQLDSRGVEWVEMRSEHGYERFKTVLERLGVPYTDIDGDINDKLDEILNVIL